MTFTPRELSVMRFALRRMAVQALDFANEAPQKNSPWPSESAEKFFRDHADAQALLNRFNREHP